MPAPSPVTTFILVEPLQEPSTSATALIDAFRITSSRLLSEYGSVALVCSVLALFALASYAFDFPLLSSESILNPLPFPLPTNLSELQALLLFFIFRFRDSVMDVGANVLSLPLSFAPGLSSLPGYASTRSVGIDHDRDAHFITRLGVRNVGKPTKRVVRSRAETLGRTSRAAPVHTTKSEGVELRISGLVNTGNTCFLNSVLQSLASLPQLRTYLDDVQLLAEKLDVPTPVTDALKETLLSLNYPRTKRRSFVPTDLVEALSSNRRTLISGAQQDAQELFGMLEDAVAVEAEEVRAEAAREFGLRNIDIDIGSEGTGAAPIELEVSKLLKNPFKGMTANRTSCVTCGYTEAVRHFVFRELSVPVPRASSCWLEECLAEYTKLELLPPDWSCRRCSLLATHRRLLAEVERLSSPPESTPRKVVASTSAFTLDSPHFNDNNKNANPATLAKADRKAVKAAAKEEKLLATRRKRLYEARRAETRVREALESGDLREDEPGRTLDEVSVERVTSRAATKQVMVGRPPRVLCIHLNRSVYSLSSFGATKNPCRVLFPEYLDITPFATTGELSMRPEAPISSSSPPKSCADTPKAGPAKGASRQAAPTFYRLAAVVVHYGSSHASGHYVSFRRRPPSHISSRSTTPLLPPRFAHPEGLHCACSECVTFGPVVDASSAPMVDANGVLTGRPTARAGRWVRISDETVEEVSLSDVLRQNPFLLFYERIEPCLSPSEERGHGKGKRVDGDAQEHIPSAFANFVFQAKAKSKASENKGKGRVVHSYGIGGARAGRRPSPPPSSEPLAALAREKNAEGVPGNGEPPLPDGARSPSSTADDGSADGYGYDDAEQPSEGDRDGNGDGEGRTILSSRRSDVTNGVQTPLPLPPPSHVENGATPGKREGKDDGDGHGRPPYAEPEDHQRRALNPDLKIDAPSASVPRSATSPPVPNRDDLEEEEAAREPAPRFPTAHAPTASSEANGANGARTKPSSKTKKKKKKKKKKDDGGGGTSEGANGLG